MSPIFFTLTSLSLSLSIKTDPPVGIVVTNWPNSGISTGPLWTSNPVELQVASSTSPLVRSTVVSHTLTVDCPPPIPVTETNMPRSGERGSVTFTWRPAGSITSPKVTPPMFRLVNRSEAIAYSLTKSSSLSPPSMPSQIRSESLSTASPGKPTGPCQDRMNTSWVEKDDLSDVQGNEVLGPGTWRATDSKVTPPKLLLIR